MSANAPEICVDHYCFWRLTPIPFSHAVVLQDQFRKEPVNVKLRSVEFLGNPAVKRRVHREEEDVHHPSIHLLAYGIATPVEGPPKANPPVVINQFTGPEGQKWILGQARFLLIPARKAKTPEPPPTTPPPPRVDHFLCYEVLDAPPVPEAMSINDQFGVTDTHELKPILFGVPVIKNKEPLIHPEVHLAIYNLLPGLRPPDPIGVNTADQLRRWQLTAEESVWLGVPSHKQWKP